MIRLWASIANKLGISQEEGLLLHALLCGWLNTLARRRAYIIVSDIVQRFSLEESDFAATYAGQLLAKGVLTPTEAEVFAGNYHDSADGTTARPTPESSAPGGGGNFAATATDS
jgi:hypothetical protein